MISNRDFFRQLTDLASAGQGHYERTGELPLNFVQELIVPPMVAATREICEVIESSHQIPDVGSSSNDLVVHYTALDAAVNMLQSARRGAPSVLRLYDSGHLNDPDEGLFLQKCFQNSPIWATDQSPSNAYVASFILPPNGQLPRCQDNLAFWRAYGRDGFGCSLTIRVPRSRLRRVIYGANGAQSAVTALCPVTSAINPLLLINEQIRAILVNAFWRASANIRFLYKTDPYQDENEARIVIDRDDIDAQHIKFATSNTGRFGTILRHYVLDNELENETMFSSGSNITLGPCVPNGLDVQASLRTLVDRTGLAGPRINISRINYRRL